MVTASVSWLAGGWTTCQTLTLIDRISAGRQIGKYRLQGWVSFGIICFKASMLFISLICFLIDGISATEH